MTPAQLEALARIRGASTDSLVEYLLGYGAELDPDTVTRLMSTVASYARIITEAAADLTTETVRAQLSASLATGEK